MSGIHYKINITIIHPPSPGEYDTSGDAKGEMNPWTHSKTTDQQRFGKNSQIEQTHVDFAKQIY